MPPGNCGGRPHRDTCPGAGGRKRLLAMYYEELRRIARRILHGDAGGVLFQPTELVNEAALRLMGLTRMSWKDRAHFLATAARVMRQVLLDEVRRALALKRQPPVLRSYCAFSCGWRRSGLVLFESCAVSWGPNAGCSNKAKARVAAAAKRQSGQPKKLSYKFKRELEQLPRKIASLEEEIARLEAEVAEPEFYAQAFEEIVQPRLEQLDARRHDLEKTMERWAELEAFAAIPRS